MQGQERGAEKVMQEDEMDFENPIHTNRMQVALKKTMECMVKTKK